MAFIATPQGVEVVVKGQQAGTPIINVYHVDAGAAVSGAILDDILAIFDNWIRTVFLTTVAIGYTVNELVVKDISVAGGVERTLAYTTGNTGIVGGESIGNNSALVVSWRTARTGRSYRGRTYLGGLTTDGLLDANNVSATFASGVATVFVNLRTALSTAGYVLSVLSKVLDKVARVAGVLTEITSLIVDTKIDSQRRRDAN